MKVLKTRNIPGFLLSLDLQRAFDCLSMSYLKYDLTRWGMDGPFLAWIRALYSGPEAQVRYLGRTSTGFSVERGTHQGCPLSPALFTLAIEPLAILLRKCPDIKGISVAGLEYKASLFADDVLLTLTQPLTTVPSMLNLLRDSSSSPKSLDHQ